MALRIGIVNPDTSHARAFSELLRTHPEVQLTSLLSFSGIRDEQNIRSFADEFSYRIENSLDTFCEAIDAVFILSVEWDTHAQIASHLLERGNTIFIDKPVACSISDLQKLSILHQNYPDKIFGGSALPWTNEVRELQQKLNAQSGEQLISIEITGPADNFFTRIHSSELLAFFLNIDRSIVSYNEKLLVKTSDTQASIVSGGEEWTIKLHTTSRPLSASISNRGVYDNVVAKFIQAACGEVDAIREMSQYFSTALQGARLNLAFSKTGETKKSVAIESLTEHDGVSSKEFADQYRSKYHDTPL